MSYVLTPLTLDELEEYFDDTAKEVIDFFLKKAIISQPEKIDNQDDLPIQIPKEHIEQWIVQALGARPIGAGSYPVDVITDTWGADVKMLSCKLFDDGRYKDTTSGETSLGQKFDDNNFGDNNTLDVLFLQKEYAFIWERWKEILLAKYQTVTDEYNIENFIYFILLRAGSTFHICGLKLDLNLLSETSINESKCTDKSIVINGFLNSSLGKINIYKSKKRLELRLRPKKWIEEGNILSFDTNFTQISCEIRNKILNDELNDYIDDILIPIIKNERDNE
jgi:hypothetical protein